jgi:hypothetical protein
MKNLIIAAAAAALLAACATPGTAPDRARSWMGATAAQLTAAWGAPDERRRTEQGETLVWRTTETVYRAGSKGNPPREFERDCAVTVALEGDPAIARSVEGLRPGCALPWMSGRGG